MRQRTQNAVQCLSYSLNHRTACVRSAFCWNVCQSMAHSPTGRLRRSVSTSVSKRGDPALPLYPRYLAQHGMRRVRDALAQPIALFLQNKRL
ncbi:MAG: hypothetical protein WC966_05280 [Bradymonadales bacterium]